MPNLVKTRGLVLGFTKYKETSIIVQIYAEEFGQQAYVVNGVRSTRGKGDKMALYQPLTFLDLVTYQKEHRDIQRISEAKLLFPYRRIPFDFRKSTISIFLSEILTKALREEAPNPELFQHLIDSFKFLDQTEESYENFHLQFMFRLSDYLGFGIATGDEWLEQLQIHGAVSEHIPDLISQLIQSDFGTKIKLNGQLRVELLQWLIRFYQIHLGGFTAIKSLPVLQELWRWIGYFPVSNFNGQW